MIDEVGLVKIAARPVSIIQAIVDTGQAASTTVVSLGALAGYGESFFNNYYWMQVIKNANSAGNAPEAEVRKITAYDSSLGTFTVSAFSQNVEASDVVLILHESQVAVGRNDADNAFDSSAVVANADGSTLERLEDIHGDLNDGLGLAFSATVESGSATTAVALSLAGFGDDFFNTKYFIQITYNTDSHGNSPEPKVRQITDYDTATGGFTFATVTDAVAVGDKILVFHESLAALGRNDADNAFDSSTVVADDDGSLLERAEYIQTQLGYGVKLLTEDLGDAGTVITSAAELTQATGFWKKALVIGITGANAGAARWVVSNILNTSVTVYPTLPSAIGIGDQFLLISAYKPQVFEQQTDVPVNLSIIQGAAATTVFDLSVAGFSYEVNYLRLKSADPVAQTITVRLYELINNVSVEVDSATIDTTNYASYFSLMDMFGENKLTGDSIKVTVELSAGATTPVVVTGQYQYAMVYTG